MVIPFAEMTSSAPAQATASRRVDPFYGHMWPSGSGGQVISWLSFNQAVASVRAGTYRMRGTDGDMTPAEAMRAMLDHHRRYSAMSLLGATFGWHILTDQQAKAVTGVTITPQSSIGQALWVSGLLQRGRFVTDAWERTRRLPAAWRVNPAAGLDLLSSRIRYSEWLGITGGQQWKTPTPPGRHGILATELAIRVAEFCPSIGAVYGERFSRWDTALPPHCVPEHTNRTADAVLVREDGLRIIVEVVASRTNNTRVAHWVDALAKDKKREVFLLYVDASPKGEAATAIRKAVNRQVRLSLDATLVDVFSRIGVIKWKDWFPALHTASEGFVTLRCVNPNREPLDLLDPFDVAFGGDAPPAIANAPLVYSVPKFQRERQPAPDLEPWVRTRAGLPLRRPVVPRTDRLHKPRTSAC